MPVSGRRLGFESDIQTELQNLLDPEEEERKRKEDEQRYNELLALFSAPSDTPAPAEKELEPTPPEKAGDPILAVQKYPRPAPLEPKPVDETEPGPQLPTVDELRNLLPTTKYAPPDRRLEPLSTEGIPEDPFERAALTRRRQVVGDKAPIENPEIEAPPAPGPDASLAEWAEYATRPVRFGVSKAAQMPGDILYGIGGALAEGAARAEESYPGLAEVPRSGRRGPEGMQERPAEAAFRPAADWLHEAAANVRPTMEKLTGTTGLTPTTFPEKIGAWTGEYLTPYAAGGQTAKLASGVTREIVTALPKSYTIPLTGSAVAARAGLTTLAADEVPIPNLVGTAEAQYLPHGFGTPGQPQVSTPQVPVAPKPGAPKVPAPAIPGSTVVPVTPAAPPDMPNVPYEPGKPGVVAPKEKGVKGEKKPRESETKQQQRDRELFQKALGVPEGMIIPPVDQRKTTRPNLKMREGRLNKKGEREGAETQEQYDRRVEAAWIVKEIEAQTYTPTANETFKNMQNLWQRVGSPEYMAMGVVGGVSTVGLLFAPRIFRAAAKAEIPVARTIAETEAGPVAAISTLKDYARFVGDDANAPLSAVYVRAIKGGDVPEASERVTETVRIQTRSGGRALSDGALETGKIKTPVFDFEAPVPLNDIARKAGPQGEEYLKLLSIHDEIVEARNAPVARAKATWDKQGGSPLEILERRAAAQSVEVEGMTLDDVNQAIRNIEDANPAIKELADGNRGWNKAKVDFLERPDTEYGILTKEVADRRRMSHTNHLGDERSIGSQAQTFHKEIGQQLENEARGKYIDEVRKLPPTRYLPGGGESLFRKTSKEEIAKHPDWKERGLITSFKRKGVDEYYITDPLIADALRLDHTSVTGRGSQAFYASKRLLESTTTGLFAPNFAVTSAIRSYWIAKFTTEQGFSAPSIFGSIMSVPRQLVPQIAKSLSRGLENGSNGILKDFFDTYGMGTAWMDTLSKRLAVAYEESVYAQIKSAGSHRGSIIEQQQRARDLEKAGSAINEWAGSNIGAPYRGLQHFWNVWRATLESIHSGVGYDFVRRNMGRENIAELAHRGRRLTGDPRAGGEYYVMEGGKQRPVRFETDGSMDQEVLKLLVQGYGWTTENVGKTAIPWWNATLQGAKRIGEAWMHDPLRFTRSVQLYAMMPAAALFYYAKHLDADHPDGTKGGDPDGRSYLDYLLNGRSAYNRQMNFYVPLPGRKASDGIEITFFHELNPFKRAIEIALHHLLGSEVPKDDPNYLFTGLPSGDPRDPRALTARKSLKEDFLTAAYAFMETAVVPPMPPLISGPAAAFGVRLPQGVFGGEAYFAKSDPYNQNGGLGTGLEGLTRAMMGGVGESLAGFYAAVTHSRDSHNYALTNGLAQVGETYLKKTPFLRDYTRVLPDISNNSDLAKEVFSDQREFNQLGRFFRKWTVDQGKINVKPPSAGGGYSTTRQLGLAEFGEGNPGLSMDEPTNPLYAKFMQKFYDRFMKESPNFVKGEDQGGIGFKSMWANYGDATQKLDRLKDVHHGSYDRWQNELNVTQEQIDAEQDPKKKFKMQLAQVAKLELDAYNVDTTDRREVVNFYRRKQFDALRVMNYAKRAVELEFSEIAGKPIKLQDIKPYATPEMQAEMSDPAMVRLLDALGIGHPFGGTPNDMFLP